QATRALNIGVSELRMAAKPAEVNCVVSVMKVKGRAVLIRPITRMCGQCRRRAGHCPESRRTGSSASAAIAERKAVSGTAPNSRTEILVNMKEAPQIEASSVSSRSCLGVKARIPCGGDAAEAGILPDCPPEFPAPDASAP